VHICYSSTERVRTKHLHPKTEKARASEDRETFCVSSVTLFSCIKSLSHPRRIKRGQEEEEERYSCGGGDFGGGDDDNDDENFNDDDDDDAPMLLAFLQREEA